MLILMYFCMVLYEIFIAFCSPAQPPGDLTLGSLVDHAVVPGVCPSSTRYLLVFSFLLTIINSNIVDSMLGSMRTCLGRRCLASVLFEARQGYRAGGRAKGGGARPHARPQSGRPDGACRHRVRNRRFFFFFYVYEYVSCDPHRTVSSSAAVES